MTYGEACIAEKESIELVNGEWIQTVFIKNKAKPMSRKDAARYTNVKLFAYWMNQLDDNLSLLRKKQIVSLYMFGHTDRHKLFKEKV